MCISCGCGHPNDAHGDPRNITQIDLDNSAQAVGISAKQAAQNILTSQGGMNSSSKIGGVDDAVSSGTGGFIASESPDMVNKNVKTTEAAFSSGTKPADKGQTSSSGQSGTGNT